MGQATPTPKLPYYNDYDRTKQETSSKPHRSSTEELIKSNEKQVRVISETCDVVMWRAGADGHWRSCQPFLCQWELLIRRSFLKKILTLTLTVRTDLKHFDFTEETYNTGLFKNDNNVNIFEI